MGGTKYEVKAGEGIGKIAKDHGFEWKTLWFHSVNKALREKRNNPNVLHPGDIVVIPEQEPKTVKCNTDLRHRFVCKLPVMKEEFRIKIEDRDGSPMAQKPYRLTLSDGSEHSGTTNGEGMVVEEVPVDAIRCKLEIEGNEWQLDIGYLNPVDEATTDDNISGAQSRLNNLGFACPASGTLDDATKAAIKAFQARNKDLKETGELDQKTREALRKRHGC